MQTGTVSGAAEVLGRSQPAVSRLLDKLECELGLSLFERRKGLIVPTPEAHQLLDDVERAYVSLDSLRYFASRLAKTGGQLSLAVMPALGIAFIPGVLSRLREEWPDTRVTLNVRMSVEVEEWAAGQQVDFGIAEMPLRRSGFRTEIFSDAPYVAAVPRGHALAARRVIGPADLCDGPLISWTSFVSAHHLLAQILQSEGVRVDATYETTLSASAYEMVKEGMGIAIIDPYTAIQQYDDRVRLLAFRPRVPFNVGLLIPETRASRPVTKAFLKVAFEERDRVLGKLPEGLL